MSAPARSEGAFVAGIVLCLAALTACASLPLDPDRGPGLASDLVLDGRLRDTLECGHGDCEDWFRVRVLEAGTLMLSVQGEPVPAGVMELGLRDDRGRPVDRVRVRRSGSLERDVTPGYWLVRVGTSDADRMIYALDTRFEPRPVERTAVPERRAPPRPRPRTVQVSGRIVEIESQAGRVQGVLFKVAGSHRLRSGMRGKLRKGGAVIGRVEVVETFPGGGGRARVLAPPSTRIDGATEIVVDVTVPQS